MKYVLLCLLLTFSAVAQVTSIPSAAAGGGSEATNPTNSGTGAAVLKTSTNVVGRTLVPGSGGGVDINEATDEVELEASPSVARITTGAGAPTGANTAGRDFYLDSTNIRYYRGLGGTSWGEVARISSGSGAPSASACDAAAEAGALYYRTDNTSGAGGHYGCAQTGSGTYAWVLLSGSGGGVADPGGNGVMVRTALNTTTNRTVTGTANEITVTNGDGVSGNPTLAISSTPDFSGKTSTKTVKTGTSAPGTCSQGELFVDTDATASSQFLVCTSTNTWTAQGVGGSSSPLLFYDLSDNSRTSSGDFTSSGTVSSASINTVGKIIRFRVSGYVNLGALGQPNLSVKFGSTTVVPSTTFNYSSTTATNHHFILDGTITVRSTGASGTTWSAAYVIASDNASGQNNYPGINGNAASTVTLDTTASHNFIVAVGSLPGSSTIVIKAVEVYGY